MSVFLLQELETTQAQTHSKTRDREVQSELHLSHFQDVMRRSRPSFKISRKKNIKVHLVYLAWHKHRQRTEVWGIACM